MAKNFAFASEAAIREYRKLPESVQDEFGKSLRCIQFGEDPFLTIEHLDGVGNGVIELKINGSPAYRCVYIAKLEDTVFVLHSFTKKTNGVDKHAMNTLKKRYRELIKELT